MRPLILARSVEESAGNFLRLIIQPSFQVWLAINAFQLVDMSFSHEYLCFRHLI